MIEVLTHFINLMLNAVEHLGYFGIALLMTIESTIIPFPAELILIPAGVLVAQGSLTIAGVAAAAIVGSVVGALINYYLAYWLGRKTINAILKRYERILFINYNHIEKSERFFAKHGPITTFLGRLVPGLRSFISLPAGFVRMNLLVFSFFTALGAGIWSMLLIGIGMLVGNNQSLVNEYLSRSVVVLLVLALLIIIIYALYHKKSNSKHARAH